MANIVAETLFLMMFPCARKRGKHLLRTQNVSEKTRNIVSLIQIFRPQQTLRAGTNRETLVYATMFPRLPPPL